MTNSSVKIYDAFISYSHTIDSQKATQLQNALQRIAKPWYRTRAMRIFRDETDLSVTPEGWPLIRKALDNSKFFLLMASEKSANSVWVTREISYWIENRSPEEIFIVLTQGDVIWSNESQDFDWQRTTALPKILQNQFDNEPFWVDLRWANTNQDLSLKNQDFFKSVAKLAAPIRGLDVDKLVNEAHRQHKRTIRIIYTVCIILITLIVIAFWQFQTSRSERVLSLISRAYRVLHLNPLQAFDDSHQALMINDTPEGREALRRAMEVAKNRSESRHEEAQLFGVGEGYLMERWRQGDVFTKIRDDGRYLIVASSRGKDSNDPPGTVFLVNLDNLRTRELFPGEQASGRRLEYMGFSNSGQDVFVARQFYLDIFSLEANRTKSIQLEYHAKPTHLISGMYGSYLLVGDTVGHLMLADTLSENRPQLEGGKHGDPALFIVSNQDRTCGLVTFESGRTDFINLEYPTSPTQTKIADDAVLFSTFGQSTENNRFLTTNRNGDVVVWNINRGKPIRAASFSHGNIAVGFAAFSKDEKRVIAMSVDGSIWSRDIRNSKLNFSYLATKP
jgi:hypothetical protein